MKEEAKTELPKKSIAAQPAKRDGVAGTVIPGAAMRSAKNTLITQFAAAYKNHGIAKQRETVLDCSDSDVESSCTSSDYSD